MNDAQRLSPAELKALFLFESLDEDQLDWLSRNGYVQDWPAGEAVYSEGEPATCFFVLLSGTLSMHRQVENTQIETNRTDQRGVYGGATSAFVRESVHEPYSTSMRAVTDCTFWLIGAAEFGNRIREWFPMAMHMLE